MTFKVPDLDELHDLLVEDYGNRLPDDDVSQGSDPWKRLRVDALLGADLHAHIDDAYDQLLPDSATGDRLARLGAIHGVDRKPATAAQKAGALRVYGDEAATVSVGDELVHKDGTTYQVNSDATVPAAGYVDVDILALSTGSVTRKTAG